ncbi:MAG: hypothetical protein HOQ24_04950 [Mycobacteriaceae bacterium]|nr:hypothetical protein [Mycobacteriaceae bacterium]
MTSARPSPASTSLSNTDRLVLLRTFGPDGRETRCSCCAGVRCVERERLRTRLGHRRFARLGRALGHPDVRVTVHGWDLQNPARDFRLLGVVRDGSAFVVRGRSGLKRFAAGQFAVTEHSDIALARALVDALPTAAAGGQFSAHPLDDSPQAQRFLDTDRRRVGYFDITAAQTDSRVRLGWQDLADDGRYLIGAGSPAVAVSVDRELLVRTLRIAVSS